VSGSPKSDIEARAVLAASREDTELAQRRSIQSHSMKDETDHEDNPRRGFLKRVAVATGSIPLAHGLVGGAAVGAVAGPVDAAAATRSPIAEAAGYTSLSPEEAAFTEAMVNVMCPADSFTPSGVDCGLAIYIDRQLAGSFGKGAKRYLRGPWAQGKPQHGYQLPLTPEQYFKPDWQGSTRPVCSGTGGRSTS
jgi:gluconate 2-dehydrogenase gamma chain